LSFVALLVAPRRITQAWRVPTALLVATAGALAPLLLYQLLDPSLAAGRALWEWSAAGGPTIQAAYRLDGLGTVGIAAGAAYVAAGLLASARSAASPRVLPSLVLVIGFVFIAVAVTIDLVAAIVVLAVLAAATAFATVLGAPNIDLSTLGLPSAYLAPRLVLLALILVAFAVRARRRGRPSISATVITVLAAVVLAGYDELRWSHLVLAAALFTVLYAAAV